MAKILMYMCVVLVFVAFHVQSAYVDLVRRGECVDNHPDASPGDGCPEWKNNGDCEPGSSYYSDMKRYCRLSCGFCRKRELYGDEPIRASREKITKDIGVKREVLNLFARGTATIMTKGVKQACLKAHNDYRALHSAPPLDWDSSLAKDSALYAQELAANNIFAHSHGNYGENLYYVGVYDTSKVNAQYMCKDAVKAWYDEIKDYSYANPGFSGLTGHFTQVIWKNTRLVGMGLAKVKRGQFTYVYAVARYTPPGNYYGQFKENVLPKSTHV